MERIVGRDHVAHLITDPESEDPQEIKRVVENALRGEGGVIINPKGKNKREVFTSDKLRSIEDATAEEIRAYLAAVTMMIIATGQSATIFEYSTSS